MEANALDEETVQLIALAKDIVKVVAARRVDSDKEMEAQLRASLAAAEFAYDAYVAMEIAAQHPIAAQFRERCRLRLERAVEHLQERVRYAMDNAGVAQFVLVASA